MSAIDKFVANLPGRMESHLNERPVCDPLQEQEESQLADSDPASYRLHVEFVHAHGVPKGPITTFSNARMASAAMSRPNGRKATGDT